MKKILIVLCMFCAFYLSSCKKKYSDEFVQINAANEITKLQNEIAKLNRNNDSLKSSTITETKLSGKIEYNYTLHQYELTRAYILVFIDLFPTSPKVPQYREYYDNILVEEEKENKIKTSQQMEMADYTGIWEIQNFTDSAGNITSKTFITTINYLDGIYSTPFVDAEPFNAQLIIVSKNEAYIRILHGGEFVTGSINSPIKYTVKFTDAKGTSTSFSAKNNSDRISLGTTYSSKLHNALIQGGNIKFQLKTTIDGQTATYDFEIPNAQFYNTVCRIKGIL